MSLRTAPIVEHASLPHGGTVTVWVGVPDDPYYDDKSQLTTVDIQLHEGKGIVASMSTVLDPRIGTYHRERSLLVGPMMSSMTFASELM